MSFELIAAKREEMGTGASRRLRHAGKLPGVIYGADKAAESIVLDHNPVYYALKEEDFHSGILNLVVDGKKEAVLLRDFQMHPYKQQVMHIDFQRVDLNAPIHVHVPLHFVNADESPAVKTQGAKITHVLNDVDVRALPNQIPHFIEVDLSKIAAGESVHLSDLKVPAGVEISLLVRGDNATVAQAVVPRGVIEAEAAAAPAAEEAKPAAE
ncbi:MAG: 50S ribosomal protein L25/general stress protein Ctc [Paludibacterium sp.]|uniref:50S ribosomal protein L25/general stress protein Ctc n=1 Tax=Paludibacterium sp. TaxID=1917523 RepID=UPI0025CF0DCC|nr:50S ribosomal protein L25/general stress protein Ctc [Paludibacterium sp.]MBV8048557.1 50S ribosomal protein L25/general stress protein Ctc [Paludibacterium sp.]MBV8647828.1 50S ribosomal protein L25/general stress protein Ctc [Paludibacterium sp.]